MVMPATEDKEEKKMEKYIGCKCIEAEPCKAWKEFGNHKIGEDGYKIVYPDGYVSWSPKDVFETVYAKTPVTIPQTFLNECICQIIGTFISKKSLEIGFERKMI